MRGGSAGAERVRITYPLTVASELVASGKYTYAPIPDLRLRESHWPK